MTTTAAPWTETMVDAAGIPVQLIKGGTGQPLLVLHDELGHPGWLRYHAALAEQYTLYIPMHPGCGQTERLDWVMSIRDLAGWYLDAMQDLGLGTVPVLGASLGGWLAAEMAVMCPQQFQRLVLVSPLGVRPPTGQIFDMFLVVSREYLRAGFVNPTGSEEARQLCEAVPTPEQQDAQEMARELASLLGWRPYMHNPTLPHLLRRLRHLPTLIVGGQQDTIVPLSAARAYHQAIPGSQLVTIDQCGHRPEIEQFDAFMRHVRAFLNAA